MVKTNKWQLTVTDPDLTIGALLERINLTDTLRQDLALATTGRFQNVFYCAVR